MPVDDLLEHAKSGTDFYALLGEDIHAASSEKDISRAYRRTALKHHPDKNRDDPNAVTKFHALQVAYDVLSDPAARAAYDAVREARERKKAQAHRLDGQRRAFADELLRAEREGLKRKRDESDEETALEREITRLAEDGRRRRQERADALKREATKARKEEEIVQEQGQKTEAPSGGTDIPAISRTVKVQFLREHAPHDLDENSLSFLFAGFGEVDSVFMLKDKRQRPTGGQHKILMGRAGIVFSSITSAYSAVTEWRQQQSDKWSMFEAVEWAQGHEPEYIKLMTNSKSKAAPVDQKKSSASVGPNLEESTFLRLKMAQQRKAERKKYEEQLRQQEAELNRDESIPADDDQSVGYG